MTARSLDDSVQYIKGVGPYRAKILHSMLGIKSVEDLLMHIPYRYDDTAGLIPIADVQLDQLVTIVGQVIDTSSRRIRGGKTMQEALIEDDSASIKAIWFNSPYLQSKLKIGSKVQLKGKVKFHQGFQLQTPEIEILQTQQNNEPATIHDHESGLIPVYPGTEQIPQRILVASIRYALDHYLALVDEPFPADFLAENQLISRRQALADIHLSTSAQTRQQALRRLKFDELFRLEMGMALRNKRVKKQEKSLRIDINETLHQRILNRFAFSLTAAQEKVIQEISQDLASPQPMNRLLQGDVGSGKTAVALYAILACVANNQQAALMAPTSILAEQHLLNFETLLAGSKVNFALLSSKCSKKERKKILDDLANHKLHFVIGTHSLIQDDVVFKNLQVVVIDEQHKFGVGQRSALRKKAPAVDLLVMTATPIPRTLTMTVFGDLDVSVLDELPPGRQTIRSRWVKPFDTQKMDDFIKQQLDNGRQAYFVYPIIDESEKLDLKSATVMAAELKQLRYSKYNIGLLHGAMKHTEKQAVLRGFEQQDYHILVATPVVEVGIDVPNATVMVVEEAQRFGLSQLHQLRGRVGRGQHASYAFFVAEARKPESIERLKTIESCTDGFKLAEVDLKLRGPGEYFGTKQTGMPELKIANIIEDYPLVKLSSHCAKQLLAKDPDWTLPEYQILYTNLRKYFKSRWHYIRSG